MELHGAQATALSMPRLTMRQVKHLDETGCPDK
jgi:hypothetical protein